VIAVIYALHIEAFPYIVILIKETTISFVLSSGLNQPEESLRRSEQV
jgi:quinol-cytochrome oxidoreductase complex cytochrome b subunit